MISLLSGEIITPLAALKKSTLNLFKSRKNYISNNNAKTDYNTNSNSCNDLILGQSIFGITIIFISIIITTIIIIIIRGSLTRALLH